jgi:hypothetical protein
VQGIPYIWENMTNELAYGMTFLVRKLMKSVMQDCAVGHDQKRALLILV